MPATEGLESPPAEGRKASAARQRILRAAFELIGKEGIGALTNRRIAAAAGVSLGSLTYHFASQDALLREALDLHVGEEVERLEAVAAELRSGASPPTAKRLVAEVQRVAVESIARTQPIAEFELHLRAARDPALRDASRRCFLAYESVALAALAALGVPEPERHARAVVAVITGVGLQWLGTGRQDARDLTDALQTIVRGAMAADKHSPDRRASR